MDRAERLREFGRELRERRKGLNIDQKVLAARLGISDQHLSQLETAYSRADRGPIGPSDEVVDAISKELNWRKFDIQKVLGRLDDDDVEVIDPAVVAANDYLRRVGGFSGDQQHSEENLAKLRKGLDMVVAGWWAEQTREKQKREEKKGHKE